MSTVQEPEKKPRKKRNVNPADFRVAVEKTAACSTDGQLNDLTQITYYEDVHACDSQVKAIKWVKENATGDGTKYRIYRFYRDLEVKTETKTVIR